MSRFASFEQNILKYVDLSEEELIRLSSFYTLKKVRKNENILSAGEVCTHEGYVLEGCFKIYYEDENLKEHILYFAVEDWWVLDIESFVSGKPACMNIQALEDAVILVIDRGQKEQLYKEIPKAEKLFRIMNQKALAAVHCRMINMLQKNADQRYLDFNEKYPTLAQRIPQHQIAAYLGVSHEFLSKIRKKIS
ncbi:Crp/Fnr family transcriptional regulator [Elizabethkingia ursingii]|uniref:Crp/Fnr family transcriptional regulator n=1 Tax=Elizabethkingia ursingii TaxID=1756150 RepID=UPI00201302C5|nr:Crp/Fnr family transcriptional regulator [Elizabethkingia ursingii]MCL1666861.1 Crp/Fnr family transcriptional regulator [Elizabethkingia ursingii]